MNRFKSLSPSCLFRVFRATLDAPRLRRDFSLFGVFDLAEQGMNVDYMVFIIVGLAVMPTKEVEQFQGLFPRIVVATQETLAQDGVTDQPAHILGEDFSVDDTNPERVAEMLQYFRRIFT